MVRDHPSGPVEPSAGRPPEASDPSVIGIVDRPERRRYEMEVDGRVAGIATYRLTDARITFIHTEIDPAFAGRGLGSRLAEFVLDDARARGLRVVAVCPFITRYIRSHPSYADLVAIPQPPGHPYAAEIEAERAGWYELAELVRSLTAEECLVPGYYRDPDWSVRDVVAHLGTWLAEAAVQFERTSAGTYEDRTPDIDALNAEFLEAMRDQPWDVVWVQANAGRTTMVQEWFSLREPTDAATWWIRKSAVEHYGEHLGRLREWVDELIARRAVSTHRSIP
jgi:predicted GNAT family acetyltransferase